MKTSSSVCVCVCSLCMARTFFCADLIDAIAIGQHATQHIEELVLLDASDGRFAHNCAFFYVFDFIFICLFVVFIILNINMCI